MDAIDLEFVPLREIESSFPIGAGVFSERELALCRELKTAKRRRDWMAGRLAAKRLVRRRWTAGRRFPMNEIEVRNRDTGEPYVEWSDGDLQHRSISISHSSRYALAALGRPGMRLGVDIETIEERGKSWLEILAHASECFEDLSLDPIRQTLLWTLKEAVLKALGVGLSVDLWDVRFIPDPDGTPLPVLGPGRLELHGKARDTWRKLDAPELSFQSAVLPDGSALSVAYGG